MSKKNRTSQNRRDRRKAKESGFARAGTTKPGRVAHHTYAHPYDTLPRQSSIPPSTVKPIHRPVQVFQRPSAEQIAARKVWMRRDSKAKLLAELERTGTTIEDLKNATLES